MQGSWVSLQACEPQSRRRVHSLWGSPSSGPLEGPQLTRARHSLMWLQLPKKTASCQEHWKAAKAALCLVGGGASVGWALCSFPTGVPLMVPPSLAPS